VKKVGLVVKDDAKAINKADEFERWLRTRNMGVVRRESSPSGLKSLDQNSGMAPPDLFCIFVLGGDGTFLSGSLDRGSRYTDSGDQIWRDRFPGGNNRRPSVRCGRSHFA